MIIIKRNISIVLCLISILAPVYTFATSVAIESDPTQSAIGDMVVLSVTLPVITSPINAVDGVLHIGNKAHVSVKEISTGNSSFTLWPVRPRYDEDTGNITFTAGQPGGIASERANIMKVILKVKENATSNITVDPIAVYLNNGKGESIKLDTYTFVLRSVASSKDPVDAWSAVKDGDVVAPEPFDAVVSNDPSAFDNKYFISFSTTDAGSGVAYYEIVEGDRSPQKINSPYLLLDQSLKEKIVIKAFDYSGNVREAQIVMLKGATRTHTVPLLITFAFLMLIIVILLRVRRNVK